jgi:bifunctional DNase/RNase
MRGYWKIGLAAALLISLGLVAISKETSPSFVEMEVKGVRLDAIGNSPVVVLADKEGKRALPIWVGLLEANAIDKELRNETSPRPMTHDLLYSILAQTHAKTKEVRIVALKDNTYYAILFLKLNKGVIEVDARPSDAIVIALKSKAPIFVSAKILDEQGIALTSKSAFGERFGIRIQELTPTLASSFNFKGNKGVLVAEVLPRSVSESSGIKAGDIIIKVNSKEVGTVRQFEEMFDAAKPGDSVKILFFRDNKFREVDLLRK